MATAFTPRTLRHRGTGTSCLNCVVQDCSTSNAGLRPQHCFPSKGTSSFARHFFTICVKTRNAGVPPSSSLFQRSQMSVEGLCDSSRLSIPFPRRSLAISSAVHSVHVYKSRSSYPLSATVDKAKSRWSGSFLYRDRLHRRRGQAIAWIPGCVGMSAAPGAMTLKPLLDQILLLGTILGVYFAGVASLPRLPRLSPGKKTSSARKDAAPSHESVQKDPARQQRSNPQYPEYPIEDGWFQLQFKLSQAVVVEVTDMEVEQVVKNPMLGLQAIARVPRLHLLLTTLQHLRKEVETISDAEQYLDLMQWQELSLSVLSSSVKPVCRDWLSQDLWLAKQPSNIPGRVLAYPGAASPVIHLEGHKLKNMASNTRPDIKRVDVDISDPMETTVLDSIFNILKESESIPSYITRSGKAGLYADLIFFLRFGSARRGGSSDHRVFKKYKGNVLEDLVVAIAEVVATLFLDCSSLASLSPHGGMWQTFLLPSILSSRSLERFRNQVALYGWLNQNFSSVAAMFEDRFDLWTLQRRVIPSQREKQHRSLSKKPVKTVIGIESDDLVLNRSQLPAARSTELRALTGWRYYYSLFLELSDVVGPLLSILLSKLGDALSFLLISLIGRSLGLIYEGIRQSISWPSNKREGRSQ